MDGLTLLIILEVLCAIVPGRAWCELPDLKFAFFDSENDIGRLKKHSNFNTMSVTSGGDIFEAEISTRISVVVVGSFGQPFAGRATYPSAQDDYIQKAKNSYNSGSEFLLNDEIIRMALVQEGGLDDLRDKNGNPTYNEADLIEAEEFYRRALVIDPYNEEAVTGILLARQALVKKRNLVWDIRCREQLRLRLTDSSVPGLKTGYDVLFKEIEILEELVHIQKESIKILLELFSDPQIRGPGALLRNEYFIESSDVAARTLQLVFSSGRRYTDTQLGLCRKRLCLNFFDEGVHTEKSSRAYALEQLSYARAYLTEVIRLLNAFTSESLNESSDLLRFSALQTKLDELTSSVNQGYNPFGFLADFVPFVTGDAENNNLSTFNKIYEIASLAVDMARVKETDAKTTETNFASNTAEYRTRLLELETSYDQRLKTIIGEMTDENGESGPDILTFLIPDKDIDNEDQVSERDNEREYLKKTYGFTFGSKGQISAQYDNIAMAEIRVEQAFNELDNVFREIEIREMTAKEICGIIDDEAKNVFHLIKDNGDQISIYLREKGRIQKETAERIAEKQKNSTVYGWLYEKGKGVVDDVADFLGLKTMTTKKNSRLQQKYWQAIVAAVSIGVQVIDNIMGTQAAGRISEIQGQCADQLADLDAKINEVQAMERAQITMLHADAQKKIELARTAQEVNLLLLKRANLELSIAMAKRDLRREWSNLFNLIDEVKTLLADRIRLTHLAKENFEGNAIGWIEDDVRDVLTNNMLIADRAFYRAQVWSFITLRALEYYANKPPDTNGQPNIQIRTMYEMLYGARRAEDLDGLLFDMHAKAMSDFLFTETTIACPERAILSLKYDVLVPSYVGYADDGQPDEFFGVDREDDFHYRDPYSELIYAGASAYQMVFRKALLQGLRGNPPLRTLSIVFSTDLFPRDTIESVIGDNPFYFPSARNAKIVGFTNPNCAGPGFSEDAQGIQVNLTGTLDVPSGPLVNLYQLGNSYLKHTQWGFDDYDAQGRLIDPLKNITVYSAYRQILPSWLIGDIDHGTEVEEETIGSAVVGTLRAMRNGIGPATKTLAFTDRSVANDRWEVEINEWDNPFFFTKLDAMLNNPIPVDPSADFLTDIQLWIGWAYRNPSINY